MLLKEKMKILLSILLVLSMSSCSQDSGTDSVSGTDSDTAAGSDADGDDTSDTSDATQDASSWSLESSLYQEDISRTFDISGDECTIVQDSSGISYSCDGNLSSSGSFTYDTLAQVVMPYLSSEEFKTTDEILIAESNVSKNDFNFYYPPLIYKGKMYGSFGGFYIEETPGSDGTTDTSYRTLYEVNEYNLSKFDHDMVLESLISKKIYSQDREHFPIFSPTVSSIMELNGFLLFNTFADYEGWSNFISYKYENHKYSLRDSKDIYTTISSPRFIYDNSTECNMIEYSNSVSITKGWMVPASGTNIAFLDGERMTQISNCSGEDVKVIEGEPDLTKPACKYSVKVDQRDKDVLSSSHISVSNDYTYFSINGAELSATTFERQGKTRFGHSNVDRSVNALDDFIAKYGNAKSYDYLQLQSEAVLDGDEIYLLATLNYEGDVDDPMFFAYSDLYLLKYNTNLELQDAALIISTSEKLLVPPEAYRLYKYGDNIYFKYQNEVYPEFYSYDVVKHQLNYTYSLRGSLRYGYELSLDYDYAITGGTIILPQNAQSTIADYDYDIVFTVLDIDTGEVIKTIRSDKLQVEDLGDYSYSTLSNYVYANSVYFIFEKGYNSVGDDYKRNLLVKIDSPTNTTKVTRFRGDNRFTGLIRNAYIESALEPKNNEERLVLEMYRYLNDGDLGELNTTLVKYIAEDKNVSVKELFNTEPVIVQEADFVASSRDINSTNLEEYNQTTPLYNLELLGDTQTFYVPLLKEVAYSSSGEDSFSDFGEARMTINAQYACNKSYFKFPYSGSFKLFGFDPVDEDREFDPIPESLTLYADVPMLVVDYNEMLSNQTMLRYGVDAIEFDSLSFLETITTTIKSNLDSLISTGISIVTGNYAAAACSTANIITNMAIDNMSGGDTYYGSAMKIYTANSNFGIDNNRSFQEDLLEGSAKSFSVDADSAGDLVEDVCSGVSLDYTSLVSFATKADYDEKHLKAKVLPTWHRGIEISELQVEIIDSKFFDVPLVSISPTQLTHVFSAEGRIAVLGTQTSGASLSRGVTNVAISNQLFQPFKSVVGLSYWLPANPSLAFDGWDGAANGVLLNAQYYSSGVEVKDSTVGTYIELTFYSDDIQMGIFTDTFFLDEAIFTDTFTKVDKTYTKTVTKPFYFPDGSPAFNRPANGSITYKISFTVN